MNSSKKIQKGQVEDFTSDSAALSLAEKQATLIAGTNIKNINGGSILGGGDLTMALMPAPHLEVLVPESTLPSVTTNFVLKGSFFTPTMNVSIVGQTINYITFVSDNEVLANVTTSASEGMYSVTLTLSNGVSATFTNALLIVLGTVYSPTTAEWTNLVASPDISNDGIMAVTAPNLRQSGIWKTIPIGTNFRIQALAKDSPYFNGVWDDLPNGGEIQLIDSTTSSVLWQVFFRKWTATAGAISSSNSTGESIGASIFPIDKLTVLERNGLIWKLSVNGVATGTFASNSNVEMKIKVKVRNNEVHDIKYIELP
jgi:hypothetical protein